MDCGGPCLWSYDGKAKIAFLPLPPHASLRRSALQAMYGHLEEEIEKLTVKLPAIGEPLRLTQKDAGGQRRDRSHSGMVNEQLCSRAMLRLFGVSQYTICMQRHPGSCSACTSCGPGCTYGSPLVFVAHHLGKEAGSTCRLLLTRTTPGTEAVTVSALCFTPSLST